MIIIMIIIQTLLDSGILPILLDIMNTAEFKTRKEAVWAVCNAISGGTPEQIRLVQPNITTTYVQTYHVCTEKLLQILYLQ